MKFTPQRVKSLKSLHSTDGVRVMIGFLVQGSVRIEMRIRVRVRVRVLFNVSIYHRSNIVAGANVGHSYTYTHNLDINFAFLLSVIKMYVFSVNKSKARKKQDFPFSVK